MKRWLLYGLGRTFTVWCLGFVYFAHYINSYDIDKTTKTDAIIVLTGGRNRISEGIKLLNNNLADRLFISGVPENISIGQIEKQAEITADDKNKIELHSVHFLNEEIRHLEYYLFKRFLFLFCGGKKNLHLIHFER